jgi:hypothetical protein
VSRFLSSSQQSLSEQETFLFRQLVDVGVTSGTIYACSGYRFLYAMGNTYTPVGIFGGIEPIQEESDPFPRGVKLWLAAVDSAQIYEPLREDMFNRPVIVWEAFLDPETFALSNTPELRWQGKVNDVAIRYNDSERGNFYEVSGETQLRRTPQRAYFNKETLWLTYSGDTFCDYQHLIPTFKSMWGQQPTNYASGVDFSGTYIPYRRIGHAIARGMAGR